MSLHRTGRVGVGVALAVALGASTARAHFLWLRAEREGDETVVHAFLAEPPVPEGPQFLKFVEEGKGSMACDIGPYYSPTGEILAGYDTPLDLHPEAAKPGWKLNPQARRKIKGGEITEY